MEDKNYIPSRTSPKGSRRGCLCWETSTYSIECCDGSVHAQGVGSVYLTETTPAFSGILDTYSGAAAAYSLRQLSSTYTGSAVKVRRSSDNTTKDIGFVSNVLDTATLETFCSGTDGFVTTWYDQSGNGNDAANATASSQPQIVLSGSIIIDNGKPAVEFRGTNNRLQADSVASYFNGTDEFLSNAMVWKTKSSAALAAFWGMGSSSSSSPLRWFGVNASSTIVRLDERDNSGTLTTTTGGDSSNQILSFVSSNMDSKTIHIDGVSIATDSGSFGSTTLNRFALGYLPRTSDALFAIGLMQECIFYNSDESSNRTGIETNINTHYSIY